MTQSLFAIMFQSDGTDGEASENAAPIDPLMRGGELHRKVAR
jgi:hypothetical protein